MTAYDLLEHFQEMKEGKKAKLKEVDDDSYLEKNVFKDKKLNKLWTKAEMAGFNSNAEFLLLFNSNYILRIHYNFRLCLKFYFIRYRITSFERRI